MEDSQVNRSDLCLSLVTDMKRSSLRFHEFCPRDFFLMLPKFFPILLSVKVLTDLVMNRQEEKMRLGVASTLKITLTLILIVLLTQQNSRDDDVLTKFTQFPTQFMAQNDQLTILFAPIIFLTCVEQSHGSGVTVTLLLFWLSVVVNMLTNLYQNCCMGCYRSDIFELWSDAGYTFTVFVHCGLLCTKKKKVDFDGEKTCEELVHPKETASWLSDFTLFWTMSIIRMGWHRSLEESEVLGLMKADQSQQVGLLMDRSIKDVKREWDANIEESSKRSRDEILKDTGMKNEKESRVERLNVSLLKLLLKSFGFKYVLFQLLRALADVMQLLDPMFTTIFMNHIQNRDKEHWSKGVVLFFIMFVLKVLTDFFQIRTWSSAHRLGRQMNAGVMLVIFKKALSMRNECWRDTTTGEIVNLMCSDADHVIRMSREVYRIVSLPFIIGISLYFLYNLVGSAMVLGVFIMFLLFPLNKLVGEKMTNIRKSISDIVDERIKLMNEIVNGIKVLKLYAWELSFMKKVQDIRARENERNDLVSLLTACIDTIMRGIPFLVKLCSFGLFLLLGGHMDATTGFLTVSIFRILSDPLSLMALFAPLYVQAAISLKRINKFLNGEDIPQGVVLKTHKCRSAISISNCNFAWDRNNETFNLADVNVDIPKGKLIAVVGTVGSGKSSLLSAMLGEMEKLDGNVEMEGSVAYVPQEAWIQNASLRDNVLFGSAMDKSHYHRAIYACALKEDIAAMKGGDLTEIGEKGINLSGGQKQRVSLARAVYSQADLYLLDDPLSAVDAHVGKHIFSKVIGHQGVLKEKTRVLVTHGIQWLPRTDYILVMKDGRVSQRGTYDELLSFDGEFAQFLRETLSHKMVEPCSMEEQKFNQKLFIRLNSLNNGDVEESKDVDCNDTTVASLNSEHPSNSDLDDSSDEENDMDSFNKAVRLETEEDTRLVGEDELDQRQAGATICLEYVKAVGYRSVVLFFSLFLIGFLFKVLNNFIVKEWSDDSLLRNISLNGSDEYVKRNWTYFGLFAITGFVETAAVFIYLLLLYKGGFKASMLLHDNLLYRILRCPLSFFDTTPSSRIITRFSKDVTSIDGLALFLRRIICESLRLTSCMVTSVIFCPAIGVYVIPAFAVFFFVFKSHAGSSRQLIRFRSKHKSPIFAHFSETLHGLSSIRAYCVQNRFIRTMEDRIDAFNRFEISEMWCDLALLMKYNFLTHVVVLISGLTCIVDPTMTAGSIGLVVMHIKMFASTIKDVFVTVTNAQTELVSLERVIAYSNKPSEALWEKSDTRPSIDWPSDGHVVFNNYKTRYREGLDLVLKGVTFKIMGGEKVGIVGRTGAGKTSLTMAVFRLLEAVDGSIEVDGKRISDLGLHDLRSKINILPQDPVIFSGSLRMNLDPLGKYSDQEMWKALEHSHLVTFVEGLPDKLDFQCGEGGKNLSVGQRQLMCLARALLRKTKILVLDEATAAVDMETDELIQKTIRTEFRECTVLTIAHRLHTIVDYDKILVLEQGAVTEFDTPTNLLANLNSTFYSLAKDAKLV